LTQNGGSAGDHFDIGERLRDTDQLDPDLVELPEPPLLRALVTEHRSCIKELERQILDEAVGDYCPRNPGGALRAQRDLLSALVGEGIHFLRHDVGSVAERA